MLLLALTPHALPELVALFLPLAAWIIASRNDDWQDLLAATFVTVAHRRAGAAGQRRGGDLGHAAGSCGAIGS